MRRKGQGDPPGGVLNRLMDDVAAELGDWTETESPKGQIIPFPERRQQAPSIIDLASLSPGQVSGLLGITEAQAIELLQLKAIALNFNNLREIDPGTGVSMTFTTSRTFQSNKG